MLYSSLDINLTEAKKRSLVKNYRRAFKFLRVVDTIIEQGSTHLFGNNIWGTRAQIERAICETEQELWARGYNPDLIPV